MIPVYLFLFTQICSLPSEFTPSLSLGAGVNSIEAVGNLKVTCAESMFCSFIHTGNYPGTKTELLKWKRKITEIWLLFSCDQAALWMVLSVRPSVCPSQLFHHVPIIVSLWNIQELLSMTEVMSMQMIKVRGQKVKVTEVKTHFSRFWTVTPVSIHIWWWHDAQSLMWHRRGALSFFKVIHQIWRSHGTTKSLMLTHIGHFRTLTPVWTHWWLWNDA